MNFEITNTQRLGNSNDPNLPKRSYIQPILPIKANIQWFLCK